LQLDLPDLGHGSTAFVGHERRHDAERSVTEAADLEEVNIVRLRASAITIGVPLCETLSPRLAVPFIPSIGYGGRR
jgi:hypothetical protein